jgi:hypothetical protein
MQAAALLRDHLDRDGGQLLAGSEGSKFVKATRQEQHAFTV